MKILILVGISSLLVFGNANATRYHTTNNYYTTEVTEITNIRITDGISDSDLAEGITTAMVASGHQFDYSTQDWQGSIVGGWYDDENAVSFGLGKRFDKVDALFHTSFTQNGNENAVLIGGTFRF